MALYQFLKDASGNNTMVFKKDLEEPTNPPLYIPMDTFNSDYQEYLEWAKTNTTDPATDPASE
tara:strand:- start:3097 stop:3285 length:189 start_codon:yes stop_codon:yes gene_type:complete